MAGRIRSKGQMMFFGRIAQVIENHARLDPRDALSGSTSRIWFMYFVKSRMTATLQHCPASEVPPPRHRIGAP